MSYLDDLDCIVNFKDMPPTNTDEATSKALLFAFQESFRLSLWVLHDRYDRPVKSYTRSAVHKEEQKTAQVSRIELSLNPKVLVPATPFCQLYERGCLDETCTPLQRSDIPKALNGVRTRCVMAAGIRGLDDEMRDYLGARAGKLLDTQVRVFTFLLADVLEGLQVSKKELFPKDVLDVINSTEV